MRFGLTQPTRLPRGGEPASAFRFSRAVAIDLTTVKWTNPAKGTVQSIGRYPTN